MSSLRTCTVMVMCGPGIETVYHVMRGPTRKSRYRGLVFLSHRAETVAVEKRPCGQSIDERRGLYAELSHKYATPEAPVIEWQREGGK